MDDDVDMEPPSNDDDNAFSFSSAALRAEIETLKARVNEIESEKEEERAVMQEQVSVFPLSVVSSVIDNNIDLCPDSWTHFMPS